MTPLVEELLRRNTEQPCDQFCLHCGELVSEGTVREGRVAHAMHRRQVHPELRSFEADCLESRMKHRSRSGLGSWTKRRKDQPPSELEFRGVLQRIHRADARREDAA